MRELDRQLEVGEETLRPNLGVDRGEQPGQPRLVHRQAATGVVEAHGGKAVLGGIPRLVVRRLRHALAHPKHPRRVSVFLARPHEQSVLLDPGCHRA